MKKSLRELSFFDVFTYIYSSFACISCLIQKKLAFWFSHIKMLISTQKQKLNQVCCSLFCVIYLGWYSKYIKKKVIVLYTATLIVF